MTLDRVPTVARLWAAAALSTVPLGLVWSAVPGVQPAGSVGPTTCDANGFCTAGVYQPGIYVPGVTITVAQSPARVFLLAAAALLVWVAVRTRTPATLRLARLATGALVVAGVLAAANRATLTLCCVVLALVLLRPLVRPRRGPAGRVLESGTVSR